MEKGVCMKNFAKLMGTIAFVAVIAFSMAGCEIFPNDDDPNGNGNGGNGGGGSNTSGSTRENAISVTVGYSSSHTISSSGTHWFKFVGTGDPVIFETRGDAVDTYIAVFEGNATRGNGDDNSGAGSNALYSRNTTSGTTYFIRIETRSGTSGTYTFVVTAPTFNIRTNPIVVTAGYSSSHIIDSSGQHWFRFQGTGGSVVFETEGNVVNTSISILVGDSTGTFLTHNTRISFTTISGTTYYIRITSSNSGTYTFKGEYFKKDYSKDAVYLRVNR